MATDESALQYEDFNNPAFDAFVGRTISEFPTPGLAVLVVHKSRIYAKGYGYSDIERRTPVTPSTLFFTGSTTKSFTASMAAHLVESEHHPEITWETPLAEIIREDFVLDQSTASGQWATNRVTIEDCLSHRTGLPRHDLAWVLEERNNREIVRALRYLPMHRDMRTKFEYSNNPYTAVSCAIEEVLDRPFKDLLKEHIFDPLKMHQTTYDIEDARDVAANHNNDMATGHLWNSKAKDYEQVPWSDIPPSRGAGGIISNVLDYAKWVQHLMKPSNLNAALSESAVDALRAPRVLVDPKPPFTGPQAYGLGLYSQVYRGREIVDHGGAIAGFMANMMMFPPTMDEILRGEEDGGWAVVTMTNAYSVAQNVICWHLIDNFLETPESERFDVAEEARKKQVMMLDAMKPGNVVERLFGRTSGESYCEPVLPMAEYEGIYEHPAYRKVQVSTRPIRDTNSSQPIANDEAASQNRDADGKHLLYLAPPASAKSYLAFAATLHHVNGEYWWSHQSTGPSSWITDRAVKVQFVIGPRGKVKGVRYQAEPEMPEEMAFFKKMK